MDDVKKTIEKIVCTRCGFGFWPKVDAETNEVVLPKNCRNQECKSPYYLKPKTKGII